MIFSWTMFTAYYMNNITENFFVKELVNLYRENIITKRTNIWIPNFRGLENMLNQIKSFGKLFTIQYVHNNFDNPLYFATEKCKDLLATSTNNSVVSNEDSLSRLNVTSPIKFLRIQVIEDKI